MSWKSPEKINKSIGSEEMYSQAFVQEPAVVHDPKATGARVLRPKETKSIVSTASNQTWCAN